MMNEENERERRVEKMETEIGSLASKICEDVVKKL